MIRIILCRHTRVYLVPEEPQNLFPMAGGTRAHTLFMTLSPITSKYLKLLWKL